MIHDMLDSLHRRVARRVQNHQSIPPTREASSTGQGENGSSPTRLGSTHDRLYDADRYIQTENTGTDINDLGGINVAASWFTDLHLIEGEWDVTEADISMFATTFDLPS
jgi:hypothetical protein